MARKKLSRQEFNIRKLGKYTNTLASLSLLTLIGGVFVGAIMILTASGLMGGIVAMMGIFFIVVSIIYYCVSQYFVYMGEGMISLMAKLLEQKEDQEVKPTE